MQEEGAGSAEHRPLGAPGPIEAGQVGYGGRARRAGDDSDEEFGASSGGPTVATPSGDAPAAAVVISGAAGPNAAVLNGRFEQVEWEVYRKVGEPSRWLYVAKNDCWMVGDTGGKDKRRTVSFGTAHSLVKAAGMPPPAGAGRWKVRDSGKWVEQTVKVRHAAEAVARFRPNEVEQAGQGVHPPEGSAVAAAGECAHTCAAPSVGIPT